MKLMDRHNIPQPDKPMTRWQRFLCYTMDWHKPVGVGFDGASIQTICLRCHQEGLADSSGAMFTDLGAGGGE